MIKWFANINLTQIMLIFSMSLYLILPAHSDTKKILPNVSPEVEACPEGTDVIPTCLRDRVTPTNAAELITGDIGVCKCIEKTKGNILETTASTGTLSKEDARKLKERRLDQISSIAATSRILNSTSYSTSVASQSGNLIGYGAGEIRAELKKNPISIDGREIASPELMETFSRIGQIPPENASWQCVTIQEYQAQRTIPTDNKFYQMLKTTSFSPADWNETSLKNQFDTAKDSERENISQKLIFLSRNPIFKSILNAQPTETISAELIATKQNQLLQTIQKLKPDENSTCATRPSGCWREIQGNGKVNEFKADAMAFINDPLVHDISSAQNAKTYMDELRRMSTEGEIVTSNNIPTTPEGYFAYMQSANTDLAKKCAGTNVEASCYTLFSNHCSQLNVIDARVRAGLRINSSELSDRLFEEEAMEARLDPNSNPAFREFNDGICLQAFANSDGKELNFFQYQAESCEGTNKLPECSERKRLLSRFLQEHNSGGDEVASSVRSSFSELVENNEYVDATAAQVATANNISETPAQIRARFGGGYPTITPRGDFVAPSSVATDSTSGSSNTGNTTLGTTAPDVGVVAPVSRVDNRVLSRRTVSQNDDVVSPQNAQNYVTTDRNPAPTFLGAINRFESTSISSPPLRDAQSQTNTVQPVNEITLTPQGARNSDNSIFTSSGSGGGILTGNSSPAPVSGTSTIGGVGSSPVATVEGTLPKKAPKTPLSLNFKYGLNKDGSIVQPDVQIIPVTDQSISLTLDQATVLRLKENPASLVLTTTQINEILANPSQEVPLQIKSVGGESVTVYAKKDGEGKLTYSLEPSVQGRLPASNGNVVRAKISASTYVNVLNDPDTVLNQNEDLINELAQKEDGSMMTLQIVSDGKPALTFEVTKKDDLLYHYRLKR